SASSRTPGPVLPRRAAGRRAVGAGTWTARNRTDETRSHCGSHPEPLMSFRHLFLVLLAGLFAGTATAAPERIDNVEAELIAENTSFKSGGYDNWVALRLRPDPGWHVYWQNPGDSGIPTQIEWRLPPGVSAGPIEWPYPHRESLREPTHYRFSGETLPPVPLRRA